MAKFVPLSGAVGDDLVKEIEPQLVMLPGAGPAQSFMVASTGGGERLASIAEPKCLQLPAVKMPAACKSIVASPNVLLGWSVPESVSAPARAALLMLAWSLVEMR